MTGSRIRWAIVGLLLAAGIGGALWHASSDTDEQRIRKAIQDGRDAIEKEDLDRTISHLSAEYKDERGWTYLIIRRLLRDAFAQFDDFQVEMNPPQIEIHEGQANVSFDVRLFVKLSGQKGLLVGRQDEPVHITFILKKESRRWLVTDVKGFQSPFAEP